MRTLRRLARPLAIGVLAIVAAVSLAGCGDSGQGLAQAACTRVHKSIAVYEKASSAPSPSAAAGDRSKATQELESALPYAARANSANPQWNPLMTTLVQAGVNTESNLIPALRAQCAAVGKSESNAPPVTAPVPG